MADIKFQCPQCQQTLEAPEDMAGMGLECPACNSQISIPAGKKAAPRTAATKKRPESKAKDSGDAPATRTSKCPKCGAAIAMGAVLCTECGFHFKKKKQLQTREGKTKGPGGGGGNLVVIALIGVILIAVGMIVWRMISR